MFQDGLSENDVLNPQQLPHPGVIAHWGLLQVPLENKAGNCLGHVLYPWPFKIVFMGRRFLQLPYHCWRCGQLGQYRTVGHRRLPPIAHAFQSRKALPLPVDNFQVEGIGAFLASCHLRGFLPLLKCTFKLAVNSG